MEAVQPLKTLRPSSRYRPVASALGIALVLFTGAMPPASAHAAARTGFVVMDLESGKVLTAQNAREDFIPASVAKVPAALGILDAMGPHQRFETRLAYTGTLKKGVIGGDLYLIGGGDPMLDHVALEDMIADLKARKITHVAGRFLYVADALPALPQIDIQQPPEASYNPPIDGLGLDFNRFRIRWTGTEPAGAELDISPMPVNTTLLPGSPPPGKEMWLPVINPGRFAAESFRTLAARQGYKLPAPLEARRDAVPKDALVVISHHSPTVAEMLSSALFYSNNIAMEGLALHASKAPTLEEAGKVLTQRVQALVPAISWGKFQLRNASGLSSDSRMTPGQCAALTAFASSWTVDTLAVRDILPPVSTEAFGRPTVQAESEATGMRAKSGTMYFARALTGIVKTNSGRQIAYCVMQDDQQARVTYDSLPLPQRTAGPARTQARAWLKKARESEKDLVKGWIETL